MSEKTTLESHDWGAEVPPCPLPSEAWPRIAAAFHLTGREIEVMRGLFDGDRQCAIAQRLGISAHTVHTHVGRVYRKLEVTNCGGMFLRVFSVVFGGEGNAAAPSSAGRAAFPAPGALH